MPMFPAGSVPVASEVRRQAGHHDDMAFAGLDVVVAARAEVALGGLIGLDAPDFDVVVHPLRARQPSTAQASRATITTMAMATMA